MSRARQIERKYYFPNAVKVDELIDCTHAKLGDKWFSVNNLTEFGGADYNSDPHNVHYGMYLSEDQARYVGFEYYHVPMEPSLPTALGAMVEIMGRQYILVDPNGDRQWFLGEENGGGQWVGNEVMMTLASEHGCKVITEGVEKQQ